MKKVLSLLLCVFIIGGLVTPVRANDDTQYKTKENESINYEISEPMSFEEIVLDYSETNNIPVDEARLDMQESLINSNVIGNDIVNPNYTTEYITISSQFTVKSTYKPSIKFYCYVSKSNYFGNIIEILKVSLDRNYNGVSKIYDGEVYVHLEDDNTIYYSLDGDWYNTGSVTGSVNVKVKVNEDITVTFGASSTSNFYYTKFIENRVKWGERISL